MSIVYLAAEDVLRIHRELVSLFNDGEDPIEPSGPRDMNLVESAVNRPRTSLGEAEKYETLEAKAAALFHSLVKNHAFHNGNKRTALVSLLAFLAMNGRRMITNVADDDVFDMVVSVAAGNFTANEWSFAQSTLGPS